MREHSDFLILNYSLFTKNKLFKFLIATFAGIVCLYYVINIFNWRQIWESLQKANIVYFFLGALITLLGFFFFRTVRWYLLLKDENLDIPFAKLYLYNSVSIGISNITPFQSGEAIKVELLRKYGGGKRLTGYTIFFLEKVLDLSTVIAMGILGVTFGFNFGISQFYFYGLAAIFFIVFVSAAGTLFLISDERLNPIKVLLRKKWHQKWIMVKVIFFTVCSWMIAVLGWKITLLSISIDISFLQSISLVSLTMLLAIISFVPGAVGISEISISTILTKMGIASSLAQSGAIALRGYALILLILSLAHWIILKFLPKKLPIVVIEKQRLEN